MPISPHARQDGPSSPPSRSADRRGADRRGGPAPLSSSALLHLVEQQMAHPQGLLRFRSEIEERFQHTREAGCVRHIVWTVLAGLLLYNLFLFSDAFMVPDVFARSRVIHLCITPVALAITFLIQRRLLRPESSLVILLLLVANTLYTASTSHAPDAIFLPFIIPMLVVFANIVLPLPFRYAVTFSVISATAVCWLASMQTRMDMGAKVFTILLQTSIGIYTLIATYAVEKSERKAYLLTLRETLRGERLLEQNRELTELSDTDGLTGVANRRVFDRNLDQLWAEHRQSRTPLALLVIDIDHFKKLNDTHGHIHGDICLRKVADRFHRLMQPHQSLARYGGEEFAVLLEGEGAFRAAAVAERLRAEIEIMPIPLAGSEDQPIHITVSIGCATIIPRPDLSPVELFVAADRALYTAKHDGRNCVREHSAASSSLTPAVTSEPSLIETTLPKSFFALKT